MPGHSEQ